MHTVADSPTISLEEKSFAVLVDMRQRAEEARVRYHAAKEDAADKKKAYDGAREIFETEFDRVVARTRGSDLPLFSQTDALEAAHSDPIARQLCERLIEAGHQVNTLQVFGFTAEERGQAQAYLEALTARTQAEARAMETGESFTMREVTVPAFLVAQDDPAPDAAEVAELVRRCLVQGLEIPPAQSEKWTGAQATVIAVWLDETAKVQTELGHNVTVEDLPAPPMFLLQPDAPEPEVETSTDEPATDTPSDSTEAAAEEPKTKSGRKVH